MTRSVVLGLALASMVAAAGGAAWSQESVPLDDFTRYVYVPSQSEPLVTVIDSQNESPVARIRVPRVPHQAVVSATTGYLATINREVPELHLYNVVTGNPGRSRASQDDRAPGRLGAPCASTS